MISKISMAVAALFLSTSALAKMAPAVTVPVLASCSGSDISVAGATCIGFLEGNLNGNKNTFQAVDAALDVWGVNLTGKVNDEFMLSSLKGNTINFTQDLYGTTIVGLHFGNVKGANGVKSNNVTAFYRFDAGLGLDSFTTKFNSLSNATLYVTGTPPVVSNPVPEPETYAMMLGGLGLVGFIARRRKQKAA